MNQDNYNDFINGLKSKYGTSYLALAEKAEQEEFVKYFAWAYHISLDEAREKMNRFIEIQKIDIYYKPYLEYKKSLETRLGVYYFVKLNSNERDKLIDLYVKYKKVKLKVKEYTKDMAFIELYHEEKNKYERIRNEADINLQNLKKMVTGRQIGIDELLKK